MKIPLCKGYYDSDENFVCGYGVDWDCEDCLCNWYSTSGNCDPRTGVRHRYETCVKHFGVLYYDLIKKDSVVSVSKTTEEGENDYFN